MKQLAVAFIHGMGSQGRKRPTDSTMATYSKDLRKNLRDELGKRYDQIAWREVFWADILQERQKEYLGKIKRSTRYDEIRSFVLCNLSDAAAYRLNPSDGHDNTYKNIHERIEDTIKELDQDTPDSAPLVVIAHSLGGHIMSNYIYDVTKNGRTPPTRFQGMRTMASFITFGCNIPIFTFSYAPLEIEPIDFPGVDLPAEKRLMPWWENYYDKDDVLGYPLKHIGPHYEALEARGELKDKSINVGGFFSSWNAASHNAYWRDADFYKPVAKTLKRLL